MATKTWKLGEVCQGGIITVETKGNKVAIIGKTWDYSKGSMRGSDQSGAKEFCRLEDDAELSGADRRMVEFLEDLTTSYYAGQIMDWIVTKVKVNKQMFW